MAAHLVQTLALKVCSSFDTLACNAALEVL